MILEDLPEVFSLFGYGLAVGLLIGAMVWLLGYAIFSGFELIRNN